MGTLEDLPNGGNAASLEGPEYAAAIPKDDTEDSYVFVSPTDAPTTDDHVAADLNAQAQCAPTADVSIKVEVQNGESSTEDGTKTESCVPDGHVSDTLEDLRLNCSVQVNESDAVLDQITVADVLQSSGIKTSEEERGLDSSQKVEDTQLFEKNQTIADPESSITNANHGEEQGVESSRMTNDIQIHDDGIVAIVKPSDTETDCRGEIEEFFQEVGEIRNHLENGPVSTKFSDAEANAEVHIEVGSSLKVEDDQILQENGIVATIKSSNTVATSRAEREAVSPRKVEDIEAQEQSDTVSTSFATMTERGKEIAVKSSQNVKDTQIYKDNGMVAFTESCDGIDNRGEEIEVESLERVDDIQESHDANLEAADCNSVNNIEKIDETGNKSEGIEIGEYQIASSSEPDHPDDLVENIEEDYRSGCALNIKKSGRTQITASEDGEKCWVVVQEQTESCAEVLLEPFVDNKVELEQNLLETDSVNDSISTAYEEGLSTSMEQVGLLKTNDDKSTSAYGCEITIVETLEISSTKPDSDPEMELNEITIDEQKVSAVLDFEQSSDTASCPKVDEANEAEVLKGTVSENGDAVPIAPDESNSANVDDSSAGSQLCPEENEPLKSNETTVPAIMIGSTPVAIGMSLSTVFHNDQILKPEVQGGIKSENDVSVVDDVQPDQKVSEKTDICLLGNTYLENKNENAHIEKDNQPTSPRNDVISERSISISAEYEGEVFPVFETPYGVCHSLVNGEGDLNTMSGVVSETDGKPTNNEAEAICESQQDETPLVSKEGSPVDASEGQVVGAEEGTSPFYYLIRVPRFDDDSIREQIKRAQTEVEKKTQDRDAIRVQIQTMRVSDNLQAAMAEERAARNSMKLKRQELDCLQLQITKVKNAMSIDEIGDKIRNIEHTIEHETLLLKEEKQLIREIKQLKQQREHLSLTMDKQDELQQILNQKDHIEERLKLLRKEVDLLRNNVVKAELVTKTAKKKYNEENLKLEKLQSQFKAADKIRQEAYANLQSMKKQLYEKSKHFWKYREAMKEAHDLASTGDRAKLQHLCVNQVETMMELWNKNDEFRKDYIRCNTRSTLRRLRTLDGRSLGPNEEPPALVIMVKESTARDRALSKVSTQESEKLVSAKTIEENEKQPAVETVETKSRTTKNKKPEKATSVETHGTMYHENEVDKARREEIKKTKEEEDEELAAKAEESRKEKELAAKAEESRKEEEAAKLKEQRKLEEKIKAKEAMERKQRIAEKAQARAVMKAQKEAEEREKQMEKRAKKKERKMAAATKTEDDGVGAKEPVEITEAPAEAPKVSENSGKQASTTKRSGKVLHHTQSRNKAKAIPPPLRNRGKRRMQAWMWVLLTVLLVGLLFVGGQRLLQ